MIHYCYYSFCTVNSVLISLYLPLDCRRLTEFVHDVICRCTVHKELSRCTFEHTRCRAAVRCAVKRSLVRGCFRVTYGRTRASVRSSVLTATARSPTGPTFARTCRRTLASSATAARRATSRSRGCRCWPSTTTRRHVTATSDRCSCRDRSHHQIYGLRLLSGIATRYVGFNEPGL